MLSADDQERFSRHLLLDHFGGAGQERVVAGCVEIDLPASFTFAARSCARALAASGIGALIVRGPWTSAAIEECKHLAPSVQIVSDLHEGDQAADVKITSATSRSMQMRPIEILLGEAPGSPAEAAALGALAAVEAVKLIAFIGSNSADRKSAARAAPQPLVAFPAPARPARDRSP